MHVYVVNPTREVWIHSDEDGNFDVISISDIAAGNPAQMNAIKVPVGKHMLVCVIRDLPHLPIAYSKCILACLSIVMPTAVSLDLAALAMTEISIYLHCTSYWACCMNVGSTS